MLIFKNERNSNRNIKNNELILTNEKKFKSLTILLWVNRYLLNGNNVKKINRNN